MLKNSSTPYIEIASRKIGEGYPVYIIAELSANHRQDFGEAEKLVRAAKAAGADAVKLQTYTADTLTIDCQAECFIQPPGSLWQGRTLYDLYREGSMPWEWQPKLKELADDLDIDLFSTAFDSTAVDFLEQMAVPAYKLASFEIVDLPLIKKIALTGKPLIISTGMATLGEIDEAVSTVRSFGASQVALLKCTSAYPAKASNMNLKTIPHLSVTFNLPAGLSDHSEGIAIPIAAAAVGASIVEKHFTLSRKNECLDAAFSLEPQEFREMVKSIRLTEQALGQVCFGPLRDEYENLSFRRSLVIVKDMKKGDLLTPENVRSIRPGGGISPKYFDMVLGKEVKINVLKGTSLTWGLI
ncbi:MAG: pseudaminic acid synthase [Deltaproteobacteria bacterium]|nr:pseudaminic acid synthase [Deltaproteobacteria bacterium]